MDAFSPVDDHSGSHYEAVLPAMVRRGFYMNIGKPVLDRLGGSILLALGILPMLTVALAVRLGVGKPVMFRQTRIGMGGKAFEFYKFRTMVPDRRVSSAHFVGVDRRRTHKSEADPRVNRLGAFLRRWSLDEMPQFWNVLKGDMSLVGPRPELPEIVSRYESWQHMRHQVKPGITGLWQVSDRSNLLHECTELDLEYLEHASFLTDLRTLFLTPLTMFRGNRGF